MEPTPLPPTPRMPQARAKILFAASLGVVLALMFWLGGNYSCYKGGGTYFPNMECREVEVLKAECWTDKGELVHIPEHRLLNVLENFSVEANKTLDGVLNDNS